MFVPSYSLAFTIYVLNILHLASISRRRLQTVQTISILKSRDDWKDMRNSLAARNCSQWWRGYLVCYFAVTAVLINMLYRFWSESVITWAQLLQKPLHKWPVFSRIRTKSRIFSIFSLYRRIRVMKTRILAYFMQWTLYYCHIISECFFILWEDDIFLVK